MKGTLIIAAALAASGCASTTGPANGRLAGHYSQGFEVDAFRPCGSQESWWVTDGEDLRRRYRELDVPPYEPVYVELRGTVGPDGSWGHLGIYRRELAVTEVLVARTATAGDCP